MSILPLLSAMFHPLRRGQNPPGAIRCKKLRCDTVGSFVQADFREEGCNVIFTLRKDIPFLRFAGAI